LIGWLRNLSARRGEPTGEERPSVAPPAGSAILVSAFAGPRAGALLLVPAGPRRPAESRLSPGAGAPAPGEDAETSALVLEGPAAGELLVAWGGALPDGLLLLDRHAVPPPRPAPFRVAAGDLRGTGYPGVTGVRVLYRTSASAGLRLGPPPGARWVVEGLRSVAVFGGKLTLRGSGEEVELRAGSVAFVEEPLAPVGLVAGNDSAFAIAFASPGATVRLA